MSGPQVVLVSMGTDHHPFARLSSWMESWLATVEPADVRCLVQEGASPVPVGAKGLGLLPKSEFQSVIAGSSVVVTQGGPGSIADARRLGFVPIVVPRLARHGEVVDDHQVDFCRHVAALGWIELAESEVELHRALDRAMGDPSTLRRPAERLSADEATAAFSARVADAMARPVKRFQLRRSAAALRIVLRTVTQT
jgi:UDP-N-acetylglucosamine transferase subunit ALG13